ncbi:MAG: DUF86 domain-containing protein [Magnetococcales bacterium]|nr:DUF86 domain-containing protein [Magnetococcales bacterium]
MIDDVILNKAATLERCVARAREEYAKDPEGFCRDFTRQDAAILNIQRACQAALDAGHHLIRRERLGIPQGSRNVFELLTRGGWIDPALSLALQRMVGFRNIAVHDYQAVHFPILVAIINEHLNDLLDFSQAIVQHAGLSRP